MVIRDATEADLDAICALGEEVNAIHHHAFPAIFAGAGSPGRDRTHWASGIGQADSVCFVAEAATKAVVIGFITVNVFDENHLLLQPCRVPRVGSVGVTARMRGQGIGAARCARPSAGPRVAGRASFGFTSGPSTSRPSRCIESSAASCARINSRKR